MKEEISPLVNGSKWLALGVGIIGLVVSGIGWIVSSRDFFVAYLFSELVWIGVSLGAMAFLMIHYLTGGKWGWPIRRFFEAAAGTLPLLAILFIPICFGLSSLYPWATPAEVAANKVLQAKQSYLNVPGYIIRAVIVFAIWISLARCMNKWSSEQDSTRALTSLKRLRKISGPGLVIYPLTVTFAYVDWVMSLEATWYSTMFPILICIGQMLSGLSLVILLLSWLGPRSTLSRILGPDNFHHLGNLLLAFVMLWAYMAFAQLLIIWSGDLPHEISWYLHRTAGGWRWVVSFLLVFHFLGPFFLLLSRQIKRHRRALTIIAGAMFLTHIVDVWWMIVPSFYPHGIYFSWIDLVALIGTGGVWFAFFLHKLTTKALLPVNDPRFAVAVTS